MKYDDIYNEFLTALTGLLTTNKEYLGLKEIYDDDSNMISSFPSIMITFDGSTEEYVSMPMIKAMVLKVKIVYWHYDLNTKVKMKDIRKAIARLAAVLRSDDTLGDFCDYVAEDKTGSTITNINITATARNEVASDAVIDFEGYKRLREV